MITSQLLTDEMLSQPMISVVSFLKEMRIQSGQGLIDLSVGNPDIPPCDAAIEELLRISERKDTHGYGNFDGQPALLDSIIRYYAARYNVVVCKEQLNVVRGVRNLLYYVAYIFAGPGDAILIPSIGYQSYALAAMFNRSEPVMVPMTKENCYIPAVWDLDESVLKRAKLLYLNYPNNPTGSHITCEQLTRIVDICRKYEILLCYDNAYNEILFDGAKPISLFEIPGAWDIGLEIMSMSKLTGLAGWRIAFATANERISNYLWNYNAVTDAAAFDGFQLAGAKALDHVIAYDDGKRLSEVYQRRRDIILKGLDKAGLGYYRSQGGFYIWIDVPDNYTDIGFVRHVCQKAQVLLTPGSYYGDEGKRNVRISLTTNETKLKEAAERLAAI